MSTTGDGRGTYFEDVVVGERFSRSVTITETHLVLGAGLIGDLNPLHVDDAFAGKSRYGTRILHGMLTGAVMGGPLGMEYHGTAIGYLEHNVRFLAPVRPGDTLCTAWTVVERVPKPKHAAGIVVLAAACRNQDDVLVAEATGKIMVAMRTPPSLSA